MLRTQDKRLFVGKLLAEIPSQQISPEISAIGVVSATSRGTTVTAGGSGHSKGNYAELSANIGDAADGFTLVINRPSGGVLYMLDVAIGAASSEVVILENVGFDLTASQEGVALSVPLAIPAGSRVAVRSQSSTGSATVDVAMLLHRGGTARQVRNRRATTYGADTATTTGTLLAWPGSANTKNTTWAELSAALTNPVRSLLILFGLRAASMTADTSALVDIGIGASSSEQAVVPDVSFGADSASDRWFPLSVEVPSVHVNAGVRLAARAQYSANNPGDIIVIGFD